jgi:voltage-gated potassium channel
VLSKLKSATDTIGELVLYYLVLVLVASVVFSVAEGKSIVDSIYWAGITATSVGYGDVTPSTLIGRITGLILAHASILFILPLWIARMASTMIENQHEFTEDEQQYILTTCKMMRERLSQGNSQQGPSAPPPELAEKAPHSEAYFRPQGRKN